MAFDTKKQVKPVRQRVYLNKDFDSLRADLLSYARAFYSDRIQDFSEASVGGLFLDMPAYVGDIMSFYLDHQFSELFPQSAVETTNIENHIKDAGVDITGASPAVVSTRYFIELPAVKHGTTYEPEPSVLPVIAQGTVAIANNGTRFELTEDLDFAKVDNAGNFEADITVGSTNSNGSPSTFIMSVDGQSISGFTRTETFVIPHNFVPFREITLAGENITEIISVRDTEGNEYFEVDAHTQDTVFRGILNPRDDSDIVERLLEIVPAPYRYTRKMRLSTRITTLTFGGGVAESLDNDIIPDPSEFAIPLYGKKVFSRFTIDPNNLLNTRTLGVAPQGTTITVEYRFGGGLSHNVASDTIRTISKLLMTFPRQPSVALAQQVRATTDVKNIESARGGENAPTVDELKSKIPSAKNSQSRIVTKEDLLSRVYTMPSNFGRVFRAGVRSNPNNPLATQLFVISRDSEGLLAPSPDSLKENLQLYLNEFRMISDAIDILDARVINYKVEFEIATEPSANKNLVVQTIIARLQKFFKIDNFQIDQPIRISDVVNIIYNNPGVVSVTNLKFKNLSGTANGREYSDHSFDLTVNTFKGLILPPPGGIFEMRYNSYDIVGQGI